jgi:hypothetical protein
VLLLLLLLLMARCRVQWLPSAGSLSERGWQGALAGDVLVVRDVQLLLLLLQYVHLRLPVLVVVLVLLVLVWWWCCC